MSEPIDHIDSHPLRFDASFAADAGAAIDDMPGAQPHLAELPDLPAKPLSALENVGAGQLYDASTMDAYARSYGRACIAHEHKRVLERIEIYIESLQSEPMPRNTIVTLRGLMLALSVEFEAQAAETAGADQADESKQEACAMPFISDLMAEHHAQAAHALAGSDKALRCWCLRCKPQDLLRTRMLVCPSCGDKRCVHARDHEAPCAKDDLFAHNAWVERNLVLPQVIAQQAQARAQFQNQAGEGSHDAAPTTSTLSVDLDHLG